jgi:hypothetical protein
MTEADDFDDTDHEPDPAEEKSPPPSPVLTTKRPLVPISGGAEPRTVPGEIVRHTDAEWHEPPFGAPYERVVPTNRPAIVERELRWHNAFYRLPRARARTGLVLVTSRNGPRPVGPSGRPARVDILRSGATLYEVDLGLHHTTVELELPSHDELFPFTGAAEIEWRVVDAAVVVRDNLHDVRDAFIPALRRHLRDVTRRHPTTELGKAEAEACAELEGWDPGTSYGLRTTVLLRLAVGAQSVEHAAERRQLLHQTEIEDLQHDLKKLADEHERERQEARLARYRSIIEAGDVDQFALQLAADPEDVKTVLEVVREKQKEERDEYVDILGRLLASNAIDRWDVEDQVNDALRWLKEFTEQVRQNDRRDERRSAMRNGHGSRSQTSS